MSDLQVENSLWNQKTETMFNQIKTDQILREKADYTKHKEAKKMKLTIEK